VVPCEIEFDCAAEAWRFDRSFPMPGWIDRTLCEQRRRRENQEADNSQQCMDPHMRPFRDQKSRRDRLTAAADSIASDATAAMKRPAHGSSCARKYDCALIT